MSRSIEGINLTVLCGSLSSDPRELELQSGSRLLRLEVTTRTDAGTDSVPIAWFDPPASAATLAAGDVVVVVGRVRRRYWSGGGAPQSQTEVLAASVVPAARAAARRAVQRAIDEVTTAAGAT